MTVGEVGLLSSAYFLAFAFGQLPVGLTLDRYGPKHVQMVLLCVAAVGTVLFAFGENFATLFAARVLIGAGLSACFMSAVKAISVSFDRHKIPSLLGGMSAVGGLDAMASTMPIEWALGQIGWRTLFLALGVLALVIAVCIGFAVPRPMHDRADRRAVVAGFPKRRLSRRGLPQNHLIGPSSTQYSVCCAKSLVGTMVARCR